MQTQAILQQFMLLSGMDTQEAARWTSLCDAAGQVLLRMLQPDAPMEDIRIALAAAAIAYYQYCLCGQGIHAQSLKLGDLSVSSENGGSSVQHAQALRDSFLENIAEYLLPQGAGLLQVMI